MKLVVELTGIEPCIIINVVTISHIVDNDDATIATLRN